LAKDKSKIGTLEILVSIFAVVFIFSMIGVINLQPIGDAVTDAVVQGTVAGSGETSAVSTVDEIEMSEGVAVTSGDETIESMAQEEGGTSVIQSGTALSSGWSAFEVGP